MMHRVVTWALAGFAVLAFIAALLFLISTLFGRTSQDISSTEGDVTTETPDVGEENVVVNPASGSRLRIQAYLPKSSEETELPAIILVPGGNGDSTDFETKKRNAQDIADLGMMVVLFDPEGRGESQGEEDYNGSIGQDGLKVVVDEVASWEGVSEVGIASFSYGVTMASGMLARYSELPVSFLIDWEGPADRNETGGCDADNAGHLKDVAECDDETFWQEREALTFIDDITVPYLRLQTERDHAQPDYEHTLKMVNAAVGGKASWVRLNDEPANVSYTETSLPRMLPEAFDREIMLKIGEYARELFNK